MFITQLEFKRIQTFLFSSTRLRDMVAANALLGQTVRVDLVSLAIRHNASKPNNVNAVQNLNNDEHISKWNKSALIEKGILSRDGGHFYAHFLSTEDAQAFITSAEQLINANLPGITAQYRIFDACLQQSDINNIPFSSIKQSNLPELHIFEKCEQSNTGIAENMSDRGNNQKISENTSIRNKHYKKVFKTNEVEPGDFASELMRGFTTNGYKATNDFDALVGTDYLAVISADGNNMGNRFSQYLKKNTKDNATFIEQQILAESFFESARETLKSATNNALKKTYKADQSTLPFQLLMLGGDDLLIACQAKFAFKLICAINEELAATNLIDNQPLTLAFGVAIASHNLPFYRIHQCAEQLNSSAKVLSRSLVNSTTDIQPSTLDWHIVTQAWLDNPITLRKEQKIKHMRINNCEQTLLLSCKPYQLDINKPNCFQKLNATAEKLTRSPGLPQDEGESLISRSVLTKLQHTLSKGPEQTKLFLSTLPKHFTNTLSNITGFEKINETILMTDLADVIELIELQYLSRNKDVN